VLHVATAEDPFVAALHKQWGEAPIRITSRTERPEPLGVKHVIINYDVMRGGHWQPHSALFVVRPESQNEPTPIDIPFVKQTDRE